MTISKSDSSALIIAITEAIQKGVAQWGSVSLPEKWEESTLELLDEATRKRLKRILDDGGLNRLVVTEIERIILGKDAYLPNEQKDLVEIECLSDPLAVARVITDHIATLPRQYRFIVRASAELAFRLKREDIDIKLSSQLRLISGKLMPESFQLIHSNELIDQRIRQGGFEGGKGFAVDGSGLYFEYRCSGYVGNRVDTRLGRDFFDQIRAFYGACIAYNIIMNFDFRNENMQPILAGNELTDSDEQLCYLSRAEDDIVKSANLATSGSYDKIVEKGEVSLESSLKPIINMFGSKESPRLTTAAIWLLRANLSPREMDRLLEAAITMEVLLGDRETSDRIGLSKLMANRCAYALGKSVVERREIIEFFVEFYKLRSDIVHSGRFKIDEDEKTTVKRGLDLATRMLRHEVSIAK